MNDLLEDPLFRVSSREGMEGLSLCQILASLSRGEDLQFTNLQLHQHHPWFAFLVQLGALTVAREGDLPTTPQGWEERLLLLSSGNRSAWKLVVHDADQPAFLQSPISEGLEVFLQEAKEELASPDAIDIAMDPRNVDLKRGRIHWASEDHWVYALVARQTFGSYTGKFNYGVIRMKSKVCARVCVGFYRDLSWSSRFIHDVYVWQKSRSELMDAMGGQTGEKALLWTLPWDGTEQTAVSLQELDPACIEVCRRIRLFRRSSSKIFARNRPTQSERVKDRSLWVGKGPFAVDIWSPTKLRETLAGSPGDFRYRRLAEVLFDADWKWPSKKWASKGASYALVQVLSNTKGKTEGFTERVILLPKGDHSLEITSLLKKISKAEGLLGSLLKDLQVPAGWTHIDEFNTEVDDAFFREISNPESDLQERWDRYLVKIMLLIFSAAMRGLNPVRVAVAENKLWSGLRRLGISRVKGGDEQGTCIE